MNHRKFTLALSSNLFNLVQLLYVFLFLGIRGIYQAVLPTVIKSSTSQGTRFFVVGTLKDWRTRKTGKPASKPETAVFGAAGGVLSVFVNCPADVVKSRMQGLEGWKYTGMLDCAYQIWTKEGFLA